MGESLGYPGFSPFFFASVAEWSKAAVLKTVGPKGLVGSNPTTGAKFQVSHYISLSASSFTPLH